MRQRTRTTLPHVRVDARSDVTRHSPRAAPALEALAEADPAIAALSLWCAHRDGDQTGTAGETITYGPEFPDMPRHEQMGLAAHHILHVALRHSVRAAALDTRLAGLFDAALFNLAADALVNEAILAGYHALPRPAVLATDLIKSSLGVSVSAAQALADWDVERLYFALKGQGTQGDETADAAAAYAERQSFEPDLEHDAGGADECNTVQDAARWRQHITRAMDAGRGAGRGIGRIGHRLGDIAQPRVPWEMMLRRLVSQAVLRAPRPSPQRPARRWLAAMAQAQRSASLVPAFEAGTRPYTDIPRIVVAVDASSSIDDARLGIFWGEVTGIARRMRAELHLLVFDDAIRYRTKSDPTGGFPAVPDIPRGGGTAFIPVIAEAQRISAAALVVFTDLEGDAGAPPQGLKVIWAVPDAGALEPPFGRLVDLSC